MIERVVLIKLKDEFATDEGRIKFREQTLSALKDLDPIQTLKVGIPADPASEESWDIVILLRFDSIADVDIYVPHPDHRRYVDEILMPQTECKKAWNFSLGD
ncbi:MAG TPA: Dabb family protein [Myxococcales bacterium]|nr:Dabb family protein [Myxococcales bacterium]HIN85599.1 Dabb family protein [Myxococcales bacterium]